jgi:hypothetical protein
MYLYCTIAVNLEILTLKNVKCKKKTVLTKTKQAIYYSFVQGMNELP